VTVVPLPEDMPPLDTVVLPSRAVIRSWVHQTLPARIATLDESAELHAELAADADPGLRDMALLGLIADASQPLEDLAYLATAWDAPFAGVANYVRATTYSHRVPTNFWQSAPKWKDQRLDVLAGFAMRDPLTRAISDFLDVAGFTGGLDPENLRVLDKARTRSRERLRAWLAWLSNAWTQFAPYFHAYKHGGLVLHRADVAFAPDDNQAARIAPSVAVWDRNGSADRVCADEHPATEIAQYANDVGRLALDIVDGFLQSRAILLESIQFDDTGAAVGLMPELQHPWTIWLQETDLTAGEWLKLGQGPRLRIVAAPASVGD
jgi:hypothetical protein